MGVVHAKELIMDDMKEKTVVSIEGIKARVDKIHVNGLQRTKDDIVLESVDPLFKACSFKEVLIEALEVRSRLLELGCFRDVSIFIDTSSGQYSTPDGLEVTFHVLELSRLTGGVNTMVGNNEGSVGIGCRMPNVLGRGERVSFDYNYGTKKSSHYAGTLSRPLHRWRGAGVQSGLYSHLVDQPWSSYKIHSLGTYAQVSLETKQVMHQMKWEGVWRELSSLSQKTSLPVREQSGHSLKSSLILSHSFDTRDSRILPSTGSLFSLSNEFAGLGGDVSFFKQEAELQLNTPLPFNCILQGCFNVGGMKRIGKKRIAICDRFYLGGPLNLRGFQMNGVGPHSGESALGAEGFWALGIHLYSPLPGLGNRGISRVLNTHCFVNAGDIGALPSPQALWEGLKLNEVMRKRGRASLGVGLVLRMGEVARLELNYCVPLAWQKDDRLDHGFQFGIGVNFI